MAQIADIVFETSTTTGTGTLNLDGAVSNFRTFVAAFGSGTTVFYRIEQRDSNDAVTAYEIGKGVVTSGSPDTLSRDTVILSSNSNALVNFGSGTKNVVSVPLALLFASLVDEDAPNGFLVRTAARTYTAVAEASLGGFRAHEQSTPDMTVRLEAGRIYAANASSVTEVAAQNTGTITAPSTNPRIDRICVDESSGAVSVITGAEAASPSAPNITSGLIPIAQVSLTTSHTQIVDSDITDERALNRPISGFANDADVLKQGRHTVYLNARAFIPTITNGAATLTEELATNDIMITGYAFDATTEEKIQTMFTPPKSWDGGTITAVPRWKGDAGAGGVSWTIAAGAFSDNDALDAALGTGVNSDDTFITADDLHVGPETAAITVGGSPADGDSIIIQVSRDVADANDTKAEDATFLGLDLFLTIDAADDS